MKNLHKKIGIGSLVALLIVGASSQVLISHASSYSQKSIYEIDQAVEVAHPKEKSELAVKLGAELFGYQIIGRNSDLDKNKIKEDDYLSPSFKNWILEILSKKDLQKPSKYFYDHVYFLLYLNECGLKEGMHRLWIGGNEFIIKLNKDINRYSVRESYIWDIVNKVNEIIND